MSLIIMCCHDTEDNGRSEYTKRTLEGLRKTVDWDKHRLVVIDNGSCEVTKAILRDCVFGMVWTYPEPTVIRPTVITLPENIGTARGINEGLKLRKPSEHCIKIDNDVVINYTGWVDEMEAAIERDNTIGVLGLKRKDLRQTPNDPDPDFRSEFVMLPHEPGERWIVVERSRDVMGTCTMLNWRLLDTVGYFVQAGVYGFDDTLMSLRSLLGGFWNGFLPHIDIDHIDVGGTEYSQVKESLAAAAWGKYHELHKGYIEGTLPLKVEL